MRQVSPQPLGISCLLLGTGVHFLEDGQMFRMIRPHRSLLCDAAHCDHYDGQGRLSNRRGGPIRAQT